LISVTKKVRHSATRRGYQCCAVAVETRSPASVAAPRARRSTVKPRSIRRRLGALGPVRAAGLGRRCVGL